ncbi:hypothetical protein BGZ51_001973 [Haplosporangium sp. Z 767]|nr:hypothetical protein BGZ51_001973 [Haplosporangium sp. Z 767]
MITGSELSLFGTHVHTGHGYGDHQDQHAKDNGRDHQRQQEQPEDNVFHFIQRILKRTQLSCTSLILALVYIDRFKARLARNLKRRTRLDQGLDYDHRSYASSITTWKPHRSVELFPSSYMSSEPSSTTTSPCSTNLSSSSSSSSSPTYTQSSSTAEEPWSSITLFLVAVICADKYLFDATYSNAEWADFTKGQYTTQMLNDLERRFLGQLQYKLYVSEPEFDGFLSYLEVVLALKQVWGRGLVTFSYSDVRILTQRLMPAYADRLHFRTLQGDMMSIVWQVMATLSRVYFTIVGTIMIAAASYATVMELSALGARAVLDSVAPSLHGPPHSGPFGSISPLLTNEAMAMQPLRCAFEWNVEGGIHSMAATTGGGRLVR